MVSKPGTLVLPRRLSLWVGFAIEFVMAALLGTPLTPCLGPLVFVAIAMFVATLIFGCPALRVLDCHDGHVAKAKCAQARFWEGQNAHTQLKHLERMQANIVTSTMTLSQVA